MRDSSASAHPASRSEQKSVTQGRILCVAMELFASRGYHRTSISMIANRAGMSRATIFWHFGDKETLFRETCRHFLVPFRRSIETPFEGGDPRTSIERQIDEHTQFIESNGILIHAFMSWVFSSPEHASWLREELMSLHGAFVRNLERSFRGLLEDRRDAAYAAGCLASLLHGNMVLTLGGAAHQPGIDRKALPGHLLDLVLAQTAQRMGVLDEAPCS